MTSTFKPTPPPRPSRANQPDLQASTCKPTSSLPHSRTNQTDLQADFVKSRIYKALQKGDNLRLISVLIRGEDISLCDPLSQASYLHLAVNFASLHTQDTFLPMVYTLSNYGIHVNAKDKHGRTALELAINKELCHIMVALIRIGTDLTDRDYRSIILSLQSPYQDELLDTFEKYEPGLWGAVKKNNAGMVHMLINSWCRINTIKTGMTLIEFAKMKRKTAEIIGILEDFDSTVEFVHATLAGDKRRMVQCRMDPRGTDPYMMDISYQENWAGPLMPRSLRDTAESMGHDHILHLIPQEPEETSEDDNDYFYQGNHFTMPDSQNKIEDETTNSEYSESIPNSIDSVPITRKARDLSDSLDSAQASALEYIKRQQSQHYFSEGLDEYPFEYLPMTVPPMSEREKRMSWDDSHQSIKKKKKRKKKRLSGIKFNSASDEIKSKTCVIQ